MTRSSPLEPVEQAFNTLKRGEYDRGVNNLVVLGEIAGAALGLVVGPGVRVAERGRVELPGRTKVYTVRSRDGFDSRPIRAGMFIEDPKVFTRHWRLMTDAANPAERRLVYQESDSVLYTAAMAFAVAYDLFKPRSRKTPGTFFEVMVGTLLGTVTGLPRGKQITLPDTAYKVTTDIVLTATAAVPSLVIPTKITTRERIVQPWAHQRILDDAFPGTYKSLIVAVSELQRAEGKVNEICLPGQVGLYQKYLAQVHALYYLDPPVAYTTAGFVKLLPTKSLSVLLEADLAALLGRAEPAPVIPARRRPPGVSQPRHPGV